MDTREKLIELCEDLETLPCCETYEAQAEYLIANDVTVQKHGRWDRVKGLVGFFTQEVQCSLCGTPQDLKSNYCPHCGAKMMSEPPKGE